jgi:hypothetical protein
MLSLADSSTPMLLAIALFAAFSAVAAFDATYYHFRRFRLWQHPETQREHAFHTARAVLMAPALFFLFSPGRGALIAGAVLVGLDLLAGILDVAVERDSRAKLGGLPHGEYVAHLVATVLHVAAEVLVFVGRLMPDASAEPCGWARAIVAVLIAGSALGAIQHLVLMARGARSPLIKELAR